MNTNSGDCQMSIDCIGNHNHNHNRKQKKSSLQVR